MLLAVVSLFVPGMISPANAAVPSDIDLTATTSLTITKLEQPVELGDPATGLPLPPHDLATLVPIAGVKFAVTNVPLDTALNTVAGWQQAASMSVVEAKTRTASLPTNTTLTTDSNGVAHTDQLGVGLFLVTETHAPAGVIPSVPFLVMLPMKESVSSGQIGDWLYDLNVYPKNARMSITLDVVDEDAYAIGTPGTNANSVRWITNGDIPRATNIDSYIITNDLDKRLKYDALKAEVKVTLTGNSGIKLDSNDYKINAPTQSSGGKISVTMTASGLAKLASAKNLDDKTRVRMSFNTSVLAEGEISNRAQVCADGACTESVVAITKWGPLGIEAVEEGNESNRIPGAKFKLYLTEAEARAGANEIVVDGVAEWTTNSAGQILINGLRLSNFVNGQTRLPGDELFRKYWVVLTQVPTGWVGSSNPLSIEVLSTLEAGMKIVVVKLHKSDPGPTPDPSAPDPGEISPDNNISQTGAQITALIVGGALLLSVGIATIFMRRRKTFEADKTSEDNNTYNSDNLNNTER